MDNGPEVQANPPHTISIQEFKDYRISKDAPKEYVLGETITRENFCSAFIQSFARSQGKRSAQYAFFAWQERQTGLDITSLFRNFPEAGGYSCFSDNEREMFVDEYNKIPTHEKPGLFKFRIHQGINEFINDMNNPEIIAQYQKRLASNGFANIDSLPPDEFRSQLSAYVRQIKQYKGELEEPLAD